MTKNQERRRQLVIDLANAVGADSSLGAPRLALDSPREVICEWLQWCDPNGSHVDSVARENGDEPYCLDGAWEALVSMVDGNCGGWR